MYTIHTEVVSASHFRTLREHAHTHTCTHIHTVTSVKKGKEQVQDRKKGKPEKGIMVKLQGGVVLEKIDRNGGHKI